MKYSTLLISLFGITALAPGQVRMTTNKALSLAFPGCTTKREIVTLDASKRRAIAKMCGQKFSKSMVFPYLAHRRGKVVGTAWFDVHKVRSKQQLVMVVLDQRQRVTRVEVLAFAEPRRFEAPQPWLQKFHGHTAGRIRPGREVPRITGATLTVQATTRCVERVLATHRIVFGPTKTLVPPKPAKTRSQSKSKSRLRSRSRPPQNR